MVAACDVIHRRFHFFTKELCVSASNFYGRTDADREHSSVGWMMEGHLDRTGKLSESGGKHVHWAIDLIE